MNLRTHHWARLSALSASTLALVVVTACATSEPAMPVAPSADTNAAADGSTLKATAPAPQTPVGDAQLEDTPVTLVASASSAQFSSNIPLRYRFELRDSNGNVVQTSNLRNIPVWEVPGDLGIAVRYTWRVRAEFENSAGPWSTVASFITPIKPPSPCGHMNDPIGIIACWMEILWDGSVGDGEHYELNVAVAKELNRAGIEGGPFGILRKAAGNNCLGYSCDILCSGQGNEQEQYDYLINDEIPTWGDSKNIHEGIRVDVCEIQEP